MLAEGAVIAEGTPVEIRARILCASNRDLQTLVESREFLPDLYFRLAGVRLRVPPLRERPEDLHALTDHFLGEFSERFGQEFRLARDASEAIIVHEWPGNVRELRNVLEGACFFARKDGVIRVRHLGSPFDDSRGPRQHGLPQQIEELERREIEKALRRCRGNKTLTARLLGVTRKGLGDRLRRLGLTAGDPDSPEVS